MNQEKEHKRENSCGKWTSGEWWIRARGRWAQRERRGSAFLVCHTEDSSFILKVMGSNHISKIRNAFLICVPLKVKIRPVFPRGKTKSHPPKPLTLPVLKVWDVSGWEGVSLFNLHRNRRVFVFIYKILFLLVILLVTLANALPASSSLFLGIVFHPLLSLLALCCLGCLPMIHTFFSISHLWEEGWYPRG